MNTSWVLQASHVEQAQTKLLYTAIYKVFGFNNYFENDINKNLIREIPESETKKVNINKRFPPIKKLVDAFARSLRKVDLDLALAKYKWLLRDNPDKVLLRYIRQEVDSCKALNALGSTIVSQIRKLDMEQIQAIGDEYFIDDNECVLLHQIAPRYLAGQDMAGRPLVIARGNQWPSWFKKKHLELWSALINEQIQLVTQEHTDGATFIYDLTNFPDTSNLESSVIKFIGECFSDNHPGLVSKLIIHNGPKVFQNTSWKIYAPMLKPRLRNKVLFTYRTPELLEHITLDQLPKSLGGFSTYDYQWIPPTEPSPIAPPPDGLVARKQSLHNRFDAITLKWVVTMYDTEGGIAEQRQKVLQEWSTLYWEMDQYVRARSLVDRSGIAARLRPETVGQPPRIMSYVSEESESTADYQSQFTFDNASVFTGYELDSVTSRGSRYAASITDSRKKGLGIMRQIGRKISISNFKRDKGDNSSLRAPPSIRDTASIRAPPSLRDTASFRDNSSLRGARFF